MFSLTFFFFFCKDPINKRGVLNLAVNHPENLFVDLINVLL